MASPEGYKQAADYIIEAPADRSQAVTMHKVGETENLTKEITNNRFITVIGEKKWLDNQNFDNQRPSEIEVYLERYIKREDGTLVNVGFGEGVDAPRQTVRAPGFSYVFEGGIGDGKYNNLVEYSDIGQKYVYRVKEVTPPNYTFVETENPVSIGNSNVIQDSISNKLITTDLRLKKIDGDSPNIVIPGVTFNLHRLGSDTADKQAISGSDGFAVFEDLIPGQYVLTE